MIHGHELALFYGSCNTMSSQWLELETQDGNKSQNSAAIGISSMYTYARRDTLRSDRARAVITNMSAEEPHHSGVQN